MHPFNCYIYFSDPKLVILICEGFSALWPIIPYLTSDVVIYNIVQYNLKLEHLKEHQRAIINAVNVSNVCNLIWLMNTQEQVNWALSLNMQAIFVNHNAWLDENLYQILDIPKKYDAVINARPFRWKRIYLADDITNLAWIKGGDYTGGTKWSWDPWYRSYSYVNLQPIDTQRIVHIINEALVGLCLSGCTGDDQQGDNEGACYSSGEYLLCGIPVVSTPSEGGRDVFYGREPTVPPQRLPSLVGEPTVFIQSPISIEGKLTIPAQNSLSPGTKLRIPLNNFPTLGRKPAFLPQSITSSGRNRMVSPHNIPFHVTDESNTNKSTNEKEPTVANESTVLISSGGEKSRFLGSNTQLPQNSREGVQSVKIAGSLPRDMVGSSACIICEPDRASVLNAVQKLQNMHLSPIKIRQRHIQLQWEMRNRFIASTTELFAKRGISIDATKLFQEKFINKMTKYHENADQVIDFLGRNFSTD